MPFLQIFADQLSQTAASLPGANVKHPSSAAVWAYAHLDIAFCSAGGGYSLGFATFQHFQRGCTPYKLVTKVTSVEASD